MVHSGPWVHYRSAPDDFHGDDLKEEHVSSSKLISYMQLVFFFFEHYAIGLIWLFSSREHG
jgi:hypothetical protein